MTNDTTKAPHCQRCGGEMVRPFDRPSHSGSHKFPEWTLWCDGCGFCDTHPDASMSIPDRAEAIKFVRRLVRAELARQALEARAIWTGDSAKERLSYVLREYEEIGTHPLRLPGEEA